MKTIPVISVGLRRAWAFVAVTSAVLSAVLMGGVSVMAGTTNYYWNAGTDFYTNDLNWIGNIAPMGGVNPAGPNGSINYQVYITNNGTILYGDGGGGPSTGYTWTNSVGSFFIGTNGNGAFDMTSGSFSLTNAGANAFVMGGGTNSIGSFSMSGGSFTVERNASTFFQDIFIVGNSTNATGVGSFSISGGLAT